VAGALNNLGYLQLQLGQPEQAHASYEESIALFKPMAATNPAFQEDLQRVINNLEELNRKEGISSGKPVLALNDRSFLPKEDPNTPLRRSVLRLLPTFTGEKPGIRPGTAFVVKLQGDRAWIATARHVVFAKDDCRPAVTVEAELYAGALPEGLLPPRLEVVLPRLEWPAEGDDLIILELRGLPADVQPLPLSSAVPSGALKVIGHQTGQTAWSVMAFTPLKSNEQQIILDGSLLPGASGSPVLNGSGEVLGLVYETTTYAKQSMDLVSAYRTAVIQRLLP
jgi:hypothetical protein